MCLGVCVCVCVCVWERGNSDSSREENGMCVYVCVWGCRCGCGYLCVLGYCWGGVGVDVGVW